MLVRPGRSVAMTFKSAEAEMKPIPARSSASPAPGFEDAPACLQVDGSGNVTGQHAGFRIGSHFQPIFSLSHGRVVGHEALLRATDAQGEPSRRRASSVCRPK
jgi:EAL domain-containing protein (putative c-di-GMP-specific phosphodiesterase class I)